MSQVPEMSEVTLVMEPPSTSSTTSVTMARFESLLKWVNTFYGINCKSVRDLCSGHMLLECLHQIMPDVVVRSTENPWREIFSILEEFCGCSLEKAVSPQKIQSGNKEHISRLVVLLLAVAVQSKNNENVISAITSLDYEAQRDIMFFIESTLAKIKSHAIMAGTFTSGVGEPLPSLDTSITLSSLSLGQSTTNKTDYLGTPASPRKSSDFSRKSSDFSFATPRRGSGSRSLKGVHPESFHNGLDSSAGAKLLMSPAIAGHRSSSHQSEGTNLSRKTSSTIDKEDLSRMRHSVRVLEGSLQVEKKVAQEYYNELCSKIQDYEELKAAHCQLERKLESLHEMKDIQDELDHTSLSLSSAEKSVQAYKGKVESLEVYKRKASEMEDRLSSYESKAALCDEYQMNVKRLESLVMEKTTATKRLELQLNKTAIELGTRSSHLENLLVEDKETKKEIKDLKSKNKHLREDASQLELKLANKNDAEVMLMQQKRQLACEIDQLRTALMRSKRDISEITARKLESETSVTTFVQEISEIQEELGSKVSMLAAREIETRTLKSSLEEMGTHVTQLQSSLKTLELAGATREASLKQEISIKTSELASKDFSIKALENTNREMENQLSQLQTRASTLELDATKLTSKNKQVRSLENNVKDLQARVLQLQHINEKLTQDKKIEISSKDHQLVSLDNARLELTTQVSDLQCLMRSLEQDIATKDTELASKGLLYESLQSIKTEYEVQISQLQNSNKKMKKSAAAKEALVESSEEARQELKKELEIEVAQYKSTIQMLRHANTSMEAELSNKGETILSLERELQIHASELKSRNKKLEEKIASKNAELKASSTKISSLIGQRDELMENLQVAQKNLATARAKYSAFENEVTGKESSLAAMKKKYTELQSRVSQLTQQVADQQSSLQSANNLTSSLANQTADVKSRCAQLQTGLKEKTEAIKSNEVVIGKYKRDLQSSEKLVGELNHRRFTTQSEQGEQVKMLIKDNHVLQASQTKILQELQLMVEKERRTRSLSVQLEGDLSMEKNRAGKLNEKVLALETELGGRYRGASVQVPFTDYHLDQPFSHDTKSKLAEFVAKTEPVDEKARVKELKRRNKQAMPHLKSSYPVEMQVKAETPTTCDDRLKHGSSKRHTLETSMPFTGRGDQQNITTDYSEIASTANSEGIQPQRLDFTPTPAPHDYRYRQSMSPPNMRGFLGADTSSEMPPTQASSSTTFDVGFSPPKGTLPKRLQETKQRRNVKDDRPPVTRRETIAASSSKKSISGSTSTNSNKPTGNSKWRKFGLRSKKTSMQ